MNLCFTDISANKVGILSVSCFFAVNPTKRIKKVRCRIWICTNRKKYHFRNFPVYGERNCNNVDFKCRLCLSVAAMTGTNGVGGESNGHNTSNSASPEKGSWTIGLINSRYHQPLTHLRPRKISFVYFSWRFWDIGTRPNFHL